MFFFFSRRIYREKAFCEVRERNEEFFDYKKIDLKRLQNLYFPKGVSRWFLFKN